MSGTSSVSLSQSEGRKEPDRRLEAADTETAAEARSESDPVSTLCSLNRAGSTLTLVDL